MIQIIKQIAKHTMVRKQSSLKLVNLGKATTMTLGGGGQTIEHGHRTLSCR